MRENGYESQEMRESRQELQVVMCSQDRKTQAATGSAIAEDFFGLKIPDLFESWIG